MTVRERLVVALLFACGAAWAVALHAAVGAGA
jgi:hypothetical protein